MALFASVLLSGCSSIGLSALNASSRLESGHAVVENLIYGEEKWHVLDVHIPKKLNNKSLASFIQTKPVVLFLYGGGWTSGNKSQYYFAASAFTDLGYLVVVPDYVKYPKGKFPEFVYDSAKALAWTKQSISQYGGDPNKLFIVGHSAGAHIGALLMADERYLNASDLRPSDVLAFAGMAGPYNFTPERSPYTKIFGPEENYSQMKVMNFIQGDEPPMMMLHGTDDKTVGILNKDTLIEKIEQFGGEYADVTYPGVSHVGILLSLHPNFVRGANPAIDINGFFRSQLHALSE